MERNPSQKTSQLVTEQDIIYAVKVLDAVGEAMDRASAKPELIPQLTLELMQKTPEILDALLAVTMKECQPVIYDLARSTINLVRSFWKIQKKTTPS
ncbi:MAG: hypothetical protein QXI87_09495 [Thermoproteota archaeon]